MKIQEPSPKQCNLCQHILPLGHFIKITIRRGKTTVREVGKCDVCREKNRVAYQKLKSRKLCPLCRLPLKNGGCPPCKESAKIKARQRRKEARENGMCQCCYSNTAILGQSRCERCVEYQKTIDIPQYLYSHAKERAKSLNLKINISPKDIIVPEYCPILGVKLTRNKKKCQYNSYSLDRIDNSKGYIKGNVHVISFKANSMKNSGTIEELEKLLAYLKSLVKPNT